MGGVSGIHFDEPLTEPRGPHESGAYPRPVYAPAREGSLPIAGECFDPVDEVAVQSSDVPGGMDRLESRRERFSAEGVYAARTARAAGLYGGTVITSPDSSRM